MSFVLSMASSVPKPSRRKGMKLKTLAIKEKIKILDRIAAGDKMRKVCADFEISSSTFYDIKKAKDKLRNFALSLENPEAAKSCNKKRLKEAKYEKLEAAVFKWYKQERVSGVPIRGIDIQNAASRFAVKMEIPHFRASSGWLFNFRSRHCLTNRKVFGESGSADHSSVEPFREKLTKIIDETALILAQVYNADETGLFWKAVPKNTQVLKQEGHIPGRKMSKERVSILCCANADGTHRLKPMVVGKAKRPRAIKNISTGKLPVIYKGNRTAWFSRELFLDWFKKHLIRYQTQVLKISWSSPPDAAHYNCFLYQVPTHC